ncbi:HEPN domain-containing protein [Paenibacillus sp. LjRoot153]|uniref:hypothetical protein n=1 Tax=Paenibacillus sp. LjRoot153 TaxID=3342270 RepID=UPI003ECFA165
MNKGTNIFEELRLSNSNERIREHFSEEIFIRMVGLLEYNNLFNSCFVYSMGLISDLTHNFNKYNTKKDKLLFLDYYMLLTQSLTTMLWLIKDHSIDTELGYLVIKDESGIDVTSNFRANQFTNAKGFHEETTFSHDEILKAIDYKLMFTDHSFFKSNPASASRDFLLEKSNRIERFYYFLQTARGEAHIPIKIVHYCTMLETLFSTDTQEVTHKISERTAKFICNTLDERKVIFNLVKEAYKIRSSTVHGSLISPKKLWFLEEQTKISVELDNLMRKIFRKILEEKEINELFMKDEEYLKTYFDNLVLM